MMTAMGKAMVMVRLFLSEVAALFSVTSLYVAVVHSIVVMPTFAAKFQRCCCC